MHIQVTRMTFIIVDTPCGQVPVLVLEDKQIPQSAAIARYLARDLGTICKEKYYLWFHCKNLIDRYSLYSNIKGPRGSMS